jgi:hypothetical protein
MEIGVYYGGRLDRLEEITKNLARETGATWGMLQMISVI